MKKLLSVLLMLSLLLTAAAGVAEEKSAVDFGRYDETVKLTYLDRDYNAGKYDDSNPERASANQNVWNDAILEYLNIDLERITAEDIEAVSVLASTMMAGGELPDAICCNGATMRMLAENETLADMQAVYDGYEQKDFLKMLYETYPDRMSQGVVNGKWVGFPLDSGFINTSVLWIRQDWLDAVNMTVPTTIDELEAVAKAFMDAKLGGENTQGLGFTLESVSTMQDIAAAYGVVTKAWNETDNGYVYGQTMPAMKDVLAKLNEFYAAGIIKPDFAVTNVLDEEVSNGQVGMLYAPAWYAVTSIQTCKNNDPKANWITADIPSLTGEAVKQWTNNTVDLFVCINAESEHPEAILKIMEMQMYMEYGPSTIAEQARLYMTEDGYSTKNMRPVGGLSDPAAHFNTTYNEVRAWVKGELAYDQCGPYTQNYLKKIEKYQAGDETQWGFYYLFTDGYTPVVTKFKAGMLVSSYTGPVTETMSLYQQSIDDALTEAMVKVIMGEDVSVYEKAVETWYASGGQQITDEVNAYYASQQ